MSVLARIVAPERRSYEIAARPLTAGLLAEVFGGVASATGRSVTATGLLNQATVFACARVLAESVASLPAITYRRMEPRGKERAYDHPLYQILHLRPNPWMSSYTWRAVSQTHLCLWGNAYSRIERDGSGAVTALYPLRPDGMERPSIAASGDLLYTYRDDKGKTTTYTAAQILHIRALSTDGIVGLSPLATALREATSLALTAEEFGGRFFRNMARPGGVLQVKGTLSDDAARRLGTSWTAAHGGMDSAHRVAVLEEGVEWKPVTIPPNEAQWLELRKFQRSEIAGWFRIPPHLIGDLERATFTNIEQQALEFVVHTLRPWLVNWEQQIMLSLMTEAERETYAVEFEVDGLLRGDSQARGVFYTALLQVGAITPNEIRALENLNPVEGGDVNFLQLSMGNMEMIGSREIESTDIGTSSAVNPEEKPARSLEVRASKADPLVSAETTAKRQLREAYGPVVAEQVRAVRERAMPLLEAGRRADFNDAVDAIHNEQVGPALDRAIRAHVTAYGAEIDRLIAREVGIKEIPGGADAFRAAIIDTIVEAYRLSSARGLKQRAERSPEPVAGVEQKLAQWENSRADRKGRDEAHRVGQAMAYDAYARSGKKQFRWQLRGSKNCPWCKQMAERTRVVGMAFIDPGRYLAEGQDKPLRVRQSLKHPPLHRACDCRVVPV